MPSSVFTGVTATLSARPKVTIALILMRSLGSMDTKNFDLCRVIRDNCAGIVGEPAILFERNKQLIFAPYFTKAPFCEISCELFNLISRCIVRRRGPLEGTPE